MLTENPYVEERDGRYYIKGSRVQVAQIAVLWLQGKQPETITTNFVFLTVAQIYGAIAFYIDHREEIDQHRAEDRAAFEAARAAQIAADPERYAELQRRFAALKAQDQAQAS